MAEVMKRFPILPCLLALLPAVLPAAGAVNRESLLHVLKTQSPAAQYASRLKNLPKGVSPKLKSSLQREQRRLAVQETARLRRVAACCEAVEKKKDINAATDSGVTLLMAVAAAGVDAATRMVLAEQPDLERQDAAGHTALHYEAAAGGTALGGLLAQQWGAAVEKADVAAVRHLLACGVSASAAVNGNPPLGLALQNGQQELFDELSYNSPLVTDRMADGRTLTELAIRGGNTAALIFLLSNGAASLEPMLNGDSPLHYLLSLGKEDCAEAFIRAAQIGNRTEGAGTTVACMAARVASPAVLRKVLPLLPGAAEEDDYGNNPLLEAARRGEPAVYDAVQELLPDCPYANRRRETVLMHAALSGRPEMVQKVLETLPPALVGQRDAENRDAADYARLLPNNPVLPLLVPEP